MWYANNIIIRTQTPIACIILCFLVGGGEDGSLKFRHSKWLKRWISNKQKMRLNVIDGWAVKSNWIIHLSTGMRASKIRRNKSERESERARGMRKGEAHNTSSNPKCLLASQIYRYQKLLFMAKRTKLMSFAVELLLLLLFSSHCLFHCHFFLCTKIFQKLIDGALVNQCRCLFVAVWWVGGWWWVVGDGCWIQQTIRWLLNGRGKRKIWTCQHFTINMRIYAWIIACSISQRSPELFGFSNRYR